MNPINVGAMPAATGARSSTRTGGPNVIYGKTRKGRTPFQYQQFTPDQMNLFKQMFGHLGPDSFLGRLASGDLSQFEETEAPAWRDFQGSMGNLASRFSGMGSGARRSSGFQNAATQEASDFSQALQSKRYAAQNQAIRDLMEMSNQLLNQRPYQQGFMQKRPSFWQRLLGSVGGGAIESLPWKSMLGGV